MREFDQGRSSSSAPPVVERHEIPELTPEDKRRDAIAKTERQLNSADLQLGELKTTQDPRFWKVKHESLEKEIATSWEALQEAKKLQADTDTLKPLEEKLAALKRGSIDAKPPKGFRKLALESEICAALTAKPEGSARDGHDRKEATIRALFERLDVAESRALIWRIKARLPEDALVAAFHELSKDRETPESPRQQRLKEVLERAGKREAQAAEPARRSLLEARRQAASREISRAVLAPEIDADLDAPVEVEMPAPRPEAASVTYHASTHETGPAISKRDVTKTSRGLTSTSEATTAAPIKVHSLDVKLGQIFEAGKPEDWVETHLMQLFGELDDSPRRELAQRFARYRPGNGDDIAARFTRLDPPVHRRLLDALTAPRPPAWSVESPAKPDETSHHTAGDGPHARTAALALHGSDDHSAHATATYQIAKRDHAVAVAGASVAAPRSGINKPGFIDNSDGANIRTGPAESGGEMVRTAPLPPATRVFVSGTHSSAPDWWYVTAYLDHTMVRGYVQGFRVNTDLPEPTAKLHQVVSGDTPEGLAIQEYKAAVRDGHDLRYYENVLLYVNQQQGRAGIAGSYQYPGVLGGGGNNIQLFAGHRIWLVSPAYAKALEGVVPDGSLTGGAVAKVKRFVGHLQDILHSITESRHHLDEVAGEYAQAIRDHVPEIIGIIAGFIMAEATSAFLAATPSGVGQLAAAIIQLSLAAFGAAGMVEAGIEAVKHAGQWLTLAWTATGKAEKITAASIEFLRMLVSLAVATLSYVGFKGNRAKAIKIARSMPTMEPALALAGGGKMGTTGVATGVALRGPGFPGPLGAAGTMMTKLEHEGGTGSSENTGTSKSHSAELEPAAGPRTPEPQASEPEAGPPVADAEGGLARSAVKGSAQAMADWVERLPSKVKKTNTPAAAYEARVAGPKNYEVTGGGERVTADGVDVAECELLEAKHVGDRQQNPWLHPERLPERVRDNILGQLEDEFRRYASVIKDPMTPAKGLRVIVSDVAAKPFFERLMAKYGILGEVIVLP